MAEVAPISWVKPPEPIRGLDHLGVQAPCIALYAQLLPGITNVTDRARYYSFHPWVICSFDKRYGDHSLDSFRRVLRRAECLFALIAIRHARRMGDEDEGLHGAGMVGRFELLRIPEDADQIVLEDYAALEGPKRYFKNKLGGLGQYYFGPMRDLRVLDHSRGGEGGQPGYDRERGHNLANAFASGVPGEEFFQALESPVLHWGDLDALAAFCPCGLRHSAVEQNLLLDLFFARSAIFQGDGSQARRASLGLLLDLAGRGVSDGKSDFAALLRGSAYSGALADGSPWRVHPDLQRAQRGWAAYQRNELLSLALQGLFASVLRAIERDQCGKLHSAADAADVATNLLRALGSKLRLPLKQLVADVRAELPNLPDWLSATHELQVGWALNRPSLRDDQLEDVARKSFALLAALLARGVDDYPYADFDLDPEYFAPGEIHLLSFRQLAGGLWSGMTVEEWIRWLAVHWGVSRHLKVALRKLRGERRDTFRIRPLEGELQVVEAPEPTYTAPRVSKAVQILRDLDLLEMREGGTVSLTELGQQELETYGAA